MPFMTEDRRFGVLDSPRNFASGMDLRWSRPQRSPERVILLKPRVQALGQIGVRIEG